MYTKLLAGLFSICLAIFCIAGTRTEIEKFTYLDDVNLDGESNRVTLRGVSRNFWYFFTNTAQFQINSETGVNISPTFAGNGIKMQSDGSIYIHPGMWVVITGDCVAIDTNLARTIITNWVIVAHTNWTTNYVETYVKTVIPNSTGGILRLGSYPNQIYSNQPGNGIEILANKLYAKGSSGIVVNANGIAAKVENPIKLTAGADGPIGLKYDSNHFSLDGSGKLVIQPDKTNLPPTQHKHNMLIGHTLPAGFPIWSNKYSRIIYGSTNKEIFNIGVNGTVEITNQIFPASLINLVGIPDLTDPTEELGTAAPWGFGWQGDVGNTTNANDANPPADVGGWNGSMGLFMLGLYPSHDFQAGVAGNLYIGYMRIIPPTNCPPTGNGNGWNNFVYTKTFLIKHPKAELSTKKVLVHSCIEGPYADLIYRGSITLSNGSAKIDIDKEFKMSDGTFEALTTNSQCFLQNDSGWDRVKGKVSKNILSIISENTRSEDVINWMVIAERNDPTIKADSLTDENGRLITEFDQEYPKNLFPSFKKQNRLRNSQDGAYFKPNIKK